MLRQPVGKKFGLPKHPVSPKAVLLKILTCPKSAKRLKILTSLNSSKKLQYFFCSKYKNAKSITK